MFSLLAINFFITDRLKLSEKDLTIESVNQESRYDYDLRTTDLD